MADATIKSRIGRSTLAASFLVASAVALTMGCGPRHRSMSSLRPGVEPPPSPRLPVSVPTPRATPRPAPRSAQVTPPAWVSGRPDPSQHDAQPHVCALADVEPYPGAPQGRTGPSASASSYPTSSPPSSGAVRSGAERSTGLLSSIPKWVSSAARHAVARRVERYLTKIIYDVETSYVGSVNQYSVSNVTSVVGAGVVDQAEIRAYWLDSAGVRSEPGRAYAMACLSVDRFLFLVNGAVAAAYSPEEAAFGAAPGAPSATVNVNATNADPHAKSIPAMAQAIRERAARLLENPISRKTNRVGRE